MIGSHSVPGVSLRAAGPGHSGRAAIGTPVKYAGQGYVLLGE